MALTVKKRRVIGALLVSSNQVEAAASAGVGHRTLSRWLTEDSEFQAELRAAETAVFDQATRSLGHSLAEAAGAALDEIVHLMKSHATSDTVRLRAAGMIVNFLLALNERRTLEGRLALVEVALEEMDNDHADH